MSFRLQVGVVGAGIAGLSAALALARAGHSVDVFEKSEFRSETGAAIIIGPNGSRILSRWGFDSDKAGALDFSQMRRIKADSIEVDSEEHFTGIKDKYGDRWLLFHRADLHSGLKDLVEHHSSQVLIHLGKSIDDIDVEHGLITLSGDPQIKKDLIIVADGAHSKLIDRVLGRPCPVIKSPMSMYRFLQPMEKVLTHPETSKFYKDQPSGFTTFYKAEVGRPGLLLNTYPCRGGDLLYAALLHPTKPSEKGVEGWSSPADPANVIADAKGFHPAVQAICEDVQDVKVYTNMWRDPIETFSNGRGILIGDAAHLMLPTHGQGASMALEDAVALEILFSNVSDAQKVPRTAGQYSDLRLSRVAAVQTMSNKMMGPPDRMLSEVKRYYKGPVPGPTAKTFSEEYNDFFFLYDIVAEAGACREKP